MSIDLGDGFPRPSARRKRSGARRSLPACRRTARSSIDGLALRRAAGSGAASCASAHPLIALVHHPLALETGLVARRCRRRCERANATRSPPRAACRRDQPVDRAHCWSTTTTFRPSASPSRVPGTDRGAAGAAAAATASCGCSSVGAVVPRKGYDVLIAALATLADLPWRLTIAGDRTRDADGRGAARCRYRAATGSATAIDVLGAVPARAARRALYAAPICSCWPRASRATAWLCRGDGARPAGVGTTAGAIPDTVPPDAGVLVAAGRREGAAARAAAC